MKIWLGRGRYKRELEMVQELIEAGHDPLNIAAAAIKISRADEKQRPIDEVAEVRADYRFRKNNSSRRMADAKSLGEARGLEAEATIGVAAIRHMKRA